MTNPTKGSAIGRALTVLQNSAVGDEQRGRVIARIADEGRTELAAKDAELAELRAKLEPMACGHLKMDLVPPRPERPISVLEPMETVLSVQIIPAYCRRCREREEAVAQGGLEEAELSFSRHWGIHKWRDVIRLPGGYVESCVTDARRCLHWENAVKGARR